MPSPFPQVTIVPDRALCYVESKHPEKLQDAIQALYKAFWVETKTISDPKVVAGALESALGKALAEEIMAAVGSEPVKAALKENTDKAFKDGCFGIPFFVATNTKGETDTFWGVDHIGVLCDHLGLEVKRKEGGFQALL
jgi:2-hydroxychromene-2-carboxylate isomerase